MTAWVVLVHRRESMARDTACGLPPHRAPYTSHDRGQAGVMVVSLWAPDRRPRLCRECWGPHTALTLEGT